MGETKTAKNTNLSADKLREYAKDMDPELLEKMIEKESPDLHPMLYELRDSMQTINHRIKPSLEAIKNNMR